VEGTSQWDLLGTLGVSLKTLGWHAIDLTDAVGKWVLEKPDTKFKLLIDCGGCKGLVEVGMPVINSAPKGSKLWLKRQNFLRQNNSTLHVPYLVMSIRKQPVSSKSRKRRSAYCPAVTEEGPPSCCKRKLYVSFADLGWNEWIIYPDGYYANYCFGVCRDLNFAHFNTHVIERYRDVFQGVDEDYYQALAPCCTPTKLSSISLIYYGHNKHIIKRDLPRMRIDECGCA
jgi:inhibin beta